MYLTMYLSKKIYFMMLFDRRRETERPFLKVFVVPTHYPKKKFNEVLNEVLNEVFQKRYILCYQLNLSKKIESLLVNCNFNVYFFLTQLELRLILQQEFYTVSMKHNLDLLLNKNEYFLDHLHVLHKSLILFSYFVFFLY